MTPARIQEQSDYDSEAQHVDHNTVAVPRTNEELNLTVLRRHDPEIQSIISVAPFAVVYVFSSESQSWVKNGVEGALFVCLLNTTTSGSERYSVFILNRKGVENFRTELKATGDVEITDEYVILQVNDDGAENKNAIAAVNGIYGLWIFSEQGGSTSHTRDVHAKLIMNCAQRSEESRAMLLQQSSTYSNGAFSHSHPVAQPTQAQTLLSLFKKS